MFHSSFVGASFVGTTTRRFFEKRMSSYILKKINRLRD
ncbi:hypothetical protein LEP1GSC052_4003 [Leptospira kmetyi serovar Malaysia str. Bejo-Iso9]|nr:hypothetical protein LEP1GSC052_4003 [Leptospira kmetyi serovar Malaysia str. Bejo-Iso9]